MGQLGLIVGTGLSAYGSYKKGREEKDALDAEAAILRKNANRRRAISQREANDERRLFELIESKALAKAAASGGGVANVTVQKVLSDISAEGEYRALSRMAAGEMDAKNMETDAALRNKAGRTAKKLGTIQAASNILQGAAQWSQQYG